MNREKIIIRTSIIGIIANVFLTVFKMLIGFLSNSIAIILDAVNNLSDALSSLITIIGTKLASKKIDKKHPFGYGRLEYLSAMIIALIVLYAGFTSLKESVLKVIKPSTPNYSVYTIIIIIIAILIKIILGLFVKRTGKTVNSDSLINSGKDAIFDSIISISTLIAAIIFIIFNISIEAYLGLIISIIIIKAGIEMLLEAISKILGESNDVEMVKNIKKTVCSFEEVLGAYDLVLNNYGPDRWTGSIHIEVYDTILANDLDKLSRDITSKVLDEHAVFLTAIGIYSVNTHDKDIITTRQNVRDIVLSCDYVKQMHGFYLSDKILRFDLVVSLDAKDRNLAHKNAIDKIQKEYPDYKIISAMDIDFSELEG